MYFSLLRLSGFAGLCLNVAKAANAIDTFKRIERSAPIIERRNGFEPFKNARLQKRASPYLNNVTSSKFKLQAFI